MKRQWKRTLSVVLSIAMLFTMTGMNTVFAAEEGTTTGASGLCEHHPQHTPECGYIEGTPEILCSHVHGDDCYKEATDCVHEHTEDCYDDSEEIDTGSEAREPVNCAHLCDEESGCVTKVLDCRHEHDVACGYAPAVTGAPCTFQCGECAKDSGQQPPPPAPCALTEGCTLPAGHEGDCVPAEEKNEADEPTFCALTEGCTLADGHEGDCVPPPPAPDNGLKQTVTGFPGFDGSGPLDVIEVTEKTTVAAIGLPQTLAAILDGQAGETVIPVTWECADGYEATEYETYDFTAVLGEEYALAEGMTEWDLPYVMVNIAGMENPLAKAAGDVATAAELKAALESATPATISVTENIDLSSNITVGANHTLNIGSGVTVTTRGGQSDYQLQIPDGKTLTLAGGGTLKADNQGYLSAGISVEGTLKLSVGSKLAAANSGEYSTGVSLGVSDTPGTLVSEGGQIALQNSGTNSDGITGGSSTVNDAVTLTGGSLTVKNTAGYGINGVRLTVTNGCAVTVENNTDASSYGIITGTVSVTDSTLRIANTVGTGLRAQTLTVTDGSTTVSNTAGTGVDIYYNSGDGLFTLTGSALTLENTGGTGLAIGSTDELHIDNSTVNCAAGGGTALYLNDGGSQLIGADGGKFALAAGAKLGNVPDRFSDRGSVYQYGGPVIVEAESGQPSVEALTAGEYVWDGASLFAKGTAPAAVTGVRVSPATANVQKGMTQQFVASVQGTNRPAQTVTWAVSGNAKAGTSISGDGLLTVAADETAGTLTVTATSTVDTGKKGTATVTVTSEPVTIYQLTVTGGTGTGEYEAGASITVTADAPQPGKQFKQWTAIGLTNGTYTTNPLTFQMPAVDVTLTAVYEDIPVDTSSIDAAISAANAAKTGITTSDSPASSVADGTKFVTTAEMQTMNDAISVAQTAKGTVATTAQAQAAAQTLNAATAAFKAAIKTGTYTSGSTGGGGGDSGDGTPSTPSTTAVTAPTEPSIPTDARTEVTATVDGTGKATANVSEKSVTDAIKAAQDAAGKNGAGKNAISVTLDLKTDKAASSIAATLPANSINELVKAGVTELRIESGAGDIRLDLATLRAIQAAGGGNVTVGMTRADAGTLSPEAQRAVGGRPVFHLSVTAGGKAVTTFGGGQVSVGLPYTPGANENPGNLCGVYVDDAGNVTWLTNSSYDANTKMLLFSTPHFSTFGVGYREAPAFTDTAGHWAKDDIDFVAARGLLSGTGNNQFSPNTGMTRRMFVTALGRLAGIDGTKYRNTKFTDVPSDAYYAPYVAWASELGITGGTSATTFSPDKIITRQELATLMVNYAKVMKYTLPKTRETIAFADHANIGSWAAEAVKAMQMAGVMNGKDGNRFDPTSTATRAEVAAMLHRYVELVIDPATAQGWTQNDAGQRLYYENGKPVTGRKLVDGKWYYLDTAGLMQYGGWKQIGGKWYYLYADGSMAVSTKIDGYEIGPDGARKES